jgi:hypothetical protein
MRKAGRRAAPAVELSFPKLTKSISGEVERRAEVYRQDGRTVSLNKLRKGRRGQGR